MRGIRELLRENQALFVDAALGGVAAKAFVGWVVVSQEPKHTAWNARQDRQPTLEGFRSDLVRAVETAEHGRFLRQPQLSARGSLRRQVASAQARLIAR